MADVSAELAAYPRLGLAGDRAIGRARQILARLARFHAHWERPDRQAQLRAYPWLGRPEMSLWDSARAYALALGRAPARRLPPAAGGPPPWEGLSADLGAFLDARPADERERWEELLIDRQALVDALAPFPPTLLHGDLDDRNIGLRWPRGAATEPSALDGPDAPELVLIDWEWMAVGPAALDVAKVVQLLPAVIAPGAPIPEAVWTDALADEYFGRYRAAGGRWSEAAGWRRAYGLASVAHGLAQLPAVHGRFLRALRGELPPPQMPGVPAEAVRQGLRAALPPMARAADLVILEARRWLG
jgi:hypothetical protein